VGKVCGAPPVGVNEKKSGGRVGCGGVDGGGGGTDWGLKYCTVNRMCLGYGIDLGLILAGFFL
jgi:hypothetical protein